MLCEVTGHSFLTKLKQPLPIPDGIRLRFRLKKQEQLDPEVFSGIRSLEVMMEYLSDMRTLL